MSLEPVKKPKPVTLDFKIEVSPEYIEEQMDEQGVEVSPEYYVSFDLREVEQPFRKKLRELLDRYHAVEPYPVFSHPTDAVAEFVVMLERWLTEAEAEDDEKTREAERAEAAEEKLQKAFKREMARWVAKAGSPRLKAALDRDYKANTTYANERSARELPNFWIDTADDCEWGNRSDPSAEALEAEEAVLATIEKLDKNLEARIVWLTEAPRALDAWLEDLEAEEFESQEAIVVTPYLGRYTAVLPVDEEFHRDAEVGDLDAEADGND